MRTGGTAGTLQTDVRSIRYQRRMLDFSPEAPAGADAGTAGGATAAVNEGAENEGAETGPAGGAPVDLADGAVLRGSWTARNGEPSTTARGRAWCWRAPVPARPGSSSSAFSV